MRTLANQPTNEQLDGDRHTTLRPTGHVDLSRSARQTKSRQTKQNMLGTDRIASSILGGMLLLRGATRGTWGGLALAGVGAALLRRGASGRCALLAAVGADTQDMEHQSSNPMQRRVRGKASIGVQAELDQVVDTWRDQANLVVFLTEDEDDRSVSRQLWEAELTKEVEGSRLAWRSNSVGSPAYGLDLFFSALPTGRGTRIDLELDYLPVRGLLGAVADRFRMRGPRQRAFEALRRSKRMTELGSLPTIEGQSRGQCAAGSNGWRSDQ